jgi:hypothetical protein
MINHTDGLTGEKRDGVLHEPFRNQFCPRPAFPVWGGARTFSSEPDAGVALRLATRALQWYSSSTCTRWNLAVCVQISTRRPAGPGAAAAGDMGNLAGGCRGIPRV